MPQATSSTRTRGTMPAAFRMALIFGVSTTRSSSQPGASSSKKAATFCRSMVPPSCIHFQFISFIPFFPGPALRVSVVVNLLVARNSLPQIFVDPPGGPFVIPGADKVIELFGVAAEGLDAVQPAEPGPQGNDRLFE